MDVYWSMFGKTNTLRMFQSYFSTMCPCALTSGPRCVARFDFEGEQGDELSFSEGDVIQLLEYVEDEWASGKLNGHVGIFPLNYVEVLEDLPPAPVQKSAPNKIALPGKYQNLCVF